jgi:hypothetical protein
VLVEGYTNQLPGLTAAAVLTLLGGVGLLSLGFVLAYWGR